MIGWDRHQRRHFDAGYQAPQPLRRNRCATNRAGRLIIGVPRVEQDRSTGLEIAVDPLDGLWRSRGLRRNHRPIEQGKEDQLVALDVDCERLGGFDRSSSVQGRRQPEETGTAHGIDLLVAGPDISQTELGCRLYDKASSARTAEECRASR